MIFPSAIIGSPPREVPLSTRLVLLTGGKAAWIGWLFAGVGLVFAIGFLGHADFSGWLHFRGELKTVPGVITASRQTHASEGGSKHRSGKPIFEHQYRFTFEGAEFTGKSFCTGGGLRDGQTVTVEFPADNPKISRIHGMRRALFGPGVGFIVILPLIGLAFAAFNLWTGFKNIWLLVNGEAAAARNTGKEITNSKVNNRPVYKMWFEFTDRNGAAQRTFIRTSRPEKLEGRPQEELFYDPRQPARCTLLHDLPGNVTLDERGAVNPCGTGAMMAATLAPALAAIGVLIALVYF